MKDYRKIYADYFSIKWDRNLFEVHHIDRNKENNDIENLLLLPKRLHKKYHWALNCVKYDFKSVDEIFNLSEKDIFNCKKYIDLFNAKSEMIKFYILKKNMEFSQYKAGEDFKEILKSFEYELYKEYCEE